MKIKKDYTSWKFENDKYSLAISCAPLVFNYMELRTFIDSNIEDVSSAMRELAKWAPKMIGSNSSSHSSVRIENLYGEEFSMSVGRNVVSVWDHTGKSVVFNKKATIFDNNLFQEIVAAMNDWTAGYVKCSDCKKIIERSKVAGRFYAGSYCNHCWVGTWKEKAEKESYD